jgi:AcrR family transcriptional regulator
MAKTQPNQNVHRTEPAVNKRREIANLAAELFDALGYHSTSMDGIAERAGLRKPTLYHYFRSKDEILFEIHSGMIESILGLHEQRLESGVNSVEALRGLMEDVINLMENHPGHLRIFLEHHRELPDRYKEEIRAQRDKFRQNIVSALEQGVEEGVFREVDVEMTALAILGMCNWTYQWLRPGSGRTAAEVADAFWDLAMNGVALQPKLARP